MVRIKYRFDCLRSILWVRLEPEWLRWRPYIWIAISTIPLHIRISRTLTSRRCCVLCLWPSHAGHTRAPRYIFGFAHVVFIISVLFKSTLALVLGLFLSFLTISRLIRLHNIVNEVIQVFLVDLLFTSTRLISIFLSVLTSFRLLLTCRLNLAFTPCSCLYWPSTPLHYHVCTHQSWMILPTIRRITPSRSLWLLVLLIYKLVAISISNSTVSFMSMWLLLVLHILRYSSLLLDLSLLSLLFLFLFNPELSSKLIEIIIKMLFNLKCSVVLWQLFFTFNFYYRIYSFF